MQRMWGELHWQIAFIVHQKIHTGEKFYELNECGKTFFRSQPSLSYITGRTWRRNLMNARNVRTPSSRNLTLLFIKELTEEGNQMNVRNVGKPVRQLSHNMYWRTPTGEKPDERCQCRKFLYIKSAHVTHQITNRGEKSYVWNECGKFFCCKSTVYTSKNTGEKRVFNKYGSTFMMKSNHMRECT